MIGSGIEVRIVEVVVEKSAIAIWKTNSLSQEFILQEISDCDYIGEIPVKEEFIVKELTE
jgi:hypothetical protein